jgi:hypothetical protein
MSLLDLSPREAVPAPALTTPEAFREKLLIEEARRLRRRRWVTVTVVALVIAAGTIVVTTIGSGGSRPALPILRVDGSTFHQTPLSRSATTNGLLDYLMPTDGADYANGWRFADRMDMAAAARQLTCMERAGQAGFGRITQVASGGNNLDYPDLAVLSRGTFASVTAGMLYQFNGPFPVKGKKTPAFDLARQRCGTSAFTEREQLLESGGIANWWRGTFEAAINQSAGFKLHDAGYDSCLLVAGLSRNALWTDSNALELKIGPALFASTLHYRSSTYARCIAPVEKWRDHVRSLHRAQLINSHRAQLAQLENQVYTYLRA